MKKNSLYSFIALSMSLLIASPGRFAYGIFIILAFLFFTICGTLVRQLIKILKMENLQQFLIPAVLIALTLIFRQLVIFYSPVISLVNGFVIFMATACSYVITRLYIKETGSLKDEMILNLKEASIFSAFAVLFFLFRDILGYGTILLPVPSGVFEVVIFETEITYMGAFFASIPGAICLFAVCLFVFASIQKKLQIFDSISVRGVENVE